MLCIRYAIECNRPSLTWWEAISGLRRGFLRNGFLARYHERVDLASYVMANMGSQVIPIVVDYTDIDPAGRGSGSGNTPARGVPHIKRVGLKAGY
jgi:hypothetical protein